MHGHIFCVWVDAFLLVHAYVLVLAPVLVLKFWRMVIGIRLLAYRCMTVSLCMQVGL